MLYYYKSGAKLTIKHEMLWWKRPKIYLEMEDHEVGLKVNHYGRENGLIPIKIDDKDIKI